MPILLCELISVFIVGLTLLSNLYFDFNSQALGTICVLGGAAFIVSYVRSLIGFGILLLIILLAEGINLHLPTFGLEWRLHWNYFVAIAIGFWLGFRVLNLPNIILERFSQHKFFGLLLLAFFSSYCVSVYRALSLNLHTTATIFSLKGLFFNLGNLETVNYFNNFFFLKELVILSSCFLIVFSLDHDFIKRLQAQRFLEKFFLFSGSLLGLFGGVSKFINFGHYQLAGDNGGINSLLADIHSYANFQFIVLLVGLGVLYRAYKSSNQKLLIAMTVFAIFNLVLIIWSRSKFMIAVLVCGFLISLLVLVFKLSKRRLLFFGWFLAFFVSLITYLALFTESHWVQQVVENGLIQVDSFAKIDRLLSFRPQFFLASLNLDRYFPAFGVGVGNFVRFGREFDLAGSEYLQGVGGENVHNYFLQVLSERGVIGAILLVAFLLLVFRIALKGKNMVTSGLIALGVLLGNVFAHSLLLVFFQLLFWLLVFQTIFGAQAESWRLLVFRKGKTLSSVGISIVLTLMIAVLSLGFEINSYSDSRASFGYGRHCAYNKYFDDRATGGLVGLDFLNKNNVASLSVVNERYQTDSAWILDTDGEKVESFGLRKGRELSPLELKNIKELAGRYSDNAILVARTCYIPRSAGENLDERVLGFRYEKD